MRSHSSRLRCRRCAAASWLRIVRRASSSGQCCSLYCGTRSHSSGAGRLVSEERRGLRDAGRAKDCREELRTAGSLGARPRADGLEQALFRRSYSASLPLSSSRCLSYEPHGRYAHSLRHPSPAPFLRLAPRQLSIPPSLRRSLNLSSFSLPRPLSVLCPPLSLTLMSVPSLRPTSRRTKSAARPRAARGSAPTSSAATPSPASHQRAPSFLLEHSRTFQNLLEHSKTFRASENLHEQHVLWVQRRRIADAGERARERTALPGHAGDRVEWTREVRIA